MLATGTWVSAFSANTRPRDGTTIATPQMGARDRQDRVVEIAPSDEIEDLARAPMHHVGGDLSGCKRAIDRARGADYNVEPLRTVDVVLGRRRLDLRFRLVEQDKAVPVERV